MAHAVAENVFAGTAMNRRAGYMYGAALDRGPQGQVGAGLAQTTSTGEFTLIAPTVDVSTTGEELTVELRVDSVEAYHHLSADHDDIVKALQDQGFSIDKVTVQLNATDRTDTGADRDMARQGQTGRDGQAQQREGQGGQSGRNDGRQDGQQRWTPGEPRDNASGDGRTEPGRPGNIYL